LDPRPEMSLQTSVCVCLKITHVDVIMEYRELAESRILFYTASTFFPVCEMGIEQCPQVLPKQGIVGASQLQSQDRVPVLYHSLAVTKGHFSTHISEQALEYVSPRRRESGNKANVLGLPEPNPGVWRRQATALVCLG
jgi:hypothetical protein